MGLISKLLTLIFSFLLFISLVFGAIFFTINLSLEYTEVQKNAAPFVEIFLRETLPSQVSTTDKILDAILSSEWAQKIPFTDTLEQSLEEKMNSGNLDNVSLQQETQQFIQEMYYANYECGYWDCFSISEVPFFLISQKSQNYWYRNFRYLGIASLVLMTLLFFLVSRKRNFFVLVGILSLLASIPLWGVKKIIPMFFTGQILDFINIFLSKSGYVATVLTAGGIILIALAIIFGLFGLGFKIFSWIDNIKIKLPKTKKKFQQETNVVQPIQTAQPIQQTQQVKSETLKTEEVKKIKNKSEKKKSKKIKKNSKK